jgi:uncharacterized membrane protein YoaK (UPF0700 family)
MPYSQSLPPEEQAAARQSPWIALGGLCLAGVAGYVNAAALSYFHVPISHMSGAVSNVGLEIVDGDIAAAGYAAAIIGGFFFGAIASGLLIGAARYSAGRRYGVTLMLEGVLLALVAFLIHEGRSAGLPLAAFACGLQNGMASSYYGLIVRTTHMTGILTDLGVMLGHFMRHRRIEPWKFIVLSGILLGFFAGGLAGAWLVRAAAEAAFYLPAAGCLLAGLVYTIWISRRTSASTPS